MLKAHTKRENREQQNCTERKFGYIIVRSKA